MPTAKDDKTDPKAGTDPYGDWTDEEKAEWDAGAKSRGRLLDEMSDGLFERLFGDEKGGAITDPDGTDAEGAPGTGKGASDKHDDPAATGAAKVPWWEKTLFGKKA